MPTLSASHSSWSDEQIEVVVITTIVVTVISIAAYYIIFKHQQPQQRPRNNVTNNTNTSSQRQAATAAAAGDSFPRHGGNSINDVNVRTRINTNNPINGPVNNIHNINNVDGENDDEGVLSILAANTRQPPHFSLPSSSSSSSSSATPVMSISKLYHEGVIPFRYTLASSYETRRSRQKHKQNQKLQASNTSESPAVPTTGTKVQPSSQQLANRKDRAKLFTKLFTTISSSSSSSSSSTGEGLAPPPSRGSNIIVSIPSNDIILKCSKLQRVLFLLGTYYNLFVLLSIDDVKNVNANCNVNDVTMNDYKKDKTRLDDLILLLRGSDGDDSDDFLSEEILPSHRILTTASISSRVAFVRQLPKAAMILDYDEECMTQLTRFGFRVILYPLTTSSDENVSSCLGREMFG